MNDWESVTELVETDDFTDVDVWTVHPIAISKKFYKQFNGEYANYTMSTTCDG